MSTAVRLAKNSAVLLAASLLERGLSVLFIAVFVRLVSQESFGIYTVVITFFEFGSLVADLGMSQVLIRDIVQRREDASAIWSNTLLLGGVWSFVGWIGLGSVGTLLGYPAEVLRLIWLVGAALVFRVVWLFSAAVLRAFERMEWVAAASSGYAACFTAAGLLCLLAGWGIPSLIGAMVLLNGLAGLGVFALVHRRFLPFVFQPDLGLWWQMVRDVWPIALLLACDVLLRRVGILFLSLLRSMHEVAIFGATIRIIDLFGLLTTSLTAALLPHLATRWGSGVAAGWRAYLYSLRFFVLLSVGLTAGTMILAQPLVLLFLGSAYAESVVPLQILLLSFFLNFVGGPMGAMLLVSKEQLVSFIPGALVVTALGVGLGLWLIPHYGYLAAAWIAVASSAGLLVFKARAIQRLTDQRVQWWAFLPRPLAAAGGMAVLLCFVRQGALLWTAPLGLLSYSLLLVLSGEFKAPEYTILWQSWKVLWQGRWARWPSR